MTGNLSLRGDSRMHFIIQNADGTTRAYIYKDKGGDGVRIDNGVDGGGTFILRKDGGFTLGSGAQIAPNGDVYGGVWGNQWISTWVNNCFAARDNNINTRATMNWVSQYFIQDVRLAAPVEYGERGLNERVQGGVMTAWADYGGSNYHVKWRELQKLIGGQWLTAAYT
ncbi:hypothetical protein FNO09_17590 [Salmonella enterica subsp. diarizonae]|nr:hypothetical protein [Salmonella enterica subsp. diarizonae]